MLGEAFHIFLPCPGTSKDGCVHLESRSYYSKYALKLFFCSYIKRGLPFIQAVPELAWISETQTKRASLTHPPSGQKAQHWIALGQGEGGKRHSHQGPTSTGTSLEGTPPTLQLNNTSPSAWCGPKTRFSLSHEPVHQTNPSFAVSNPVSSAFWEVFYPWRTSGKHLLNKSTLSSVLLQNTAIKIKPSSLETSYFTFMPLDCCTEITLYHFPWGVQGLSLIWPSKPQFSEPVSDWTSLASGVDQLSFKLGATEAMLAGRWKT